MRGLVLYLAIGSALAVAIAYPFVGFLTWEWMNLMHPHRLTYGSSASFNLTQYVAVITLGSWLISKERKMPDFSPAFVLILGFMAWLFVAQAFSLAPIESAKFHDRFLKVLVFALLGLLIIDSKLRIQATIWILVLSTSYFGVKGGAFTIVSGGANHVIGPPGSIISDNNHLGLAIACTIPLLVYLYQTTESWLVKRALIVAGILDLFAVLGTQSRGAFVALLAMGAVLWWRAPRKLLSLGAIAIVAVPAILFMPEDWSNRMMTIRDYQTDGSFQGRVDAWVINWNIASAHPLTGGGLRSAYDQEIATQYLGKFREARAAHSIYFEVLGGTGFAGLFIFMAILLRTQLVLQKLRKVLGDSPTGDWGVQLATALQTSLTALMIGGLAVSMEMWEGLWLILVISASLECIHQQQLGSRLTSIHFPLEIDRNKGQTK